MLIYDSKGNAVNLLESNDFVVKKKVFEKVPLEANKAKEICKVRDIANSSKMISPIQVSDIISTPYNDDIFLVVYKKYSSLIIAYTNYTQEVSFEISWVEKA